MKRTKFVLAMALAVYLIVSVTTITLAAKTITVLYGGGSLETMQIMEMAVNLWNEEHDHIKVELQMVPGSGFWDKFKVMMATRQLPDILRADDDWVGEYFVRGQFLDLTPLVERDIDTTKFWPDGWKPFMYENKIYALPFKGDVVATYYNEDLFDEAGIPYPDENFTWDDLLDAAKKTTKQTAEGRPDTFGFGIRSQWLYPQTWVWRNGGSLFNREKTESTLTEKAAVDALQWYVDLRHKHGVAPSASLEKEEGSETLFQAGRLAMWEAGNWGLLKYRQQRDVGTLNFGIALPAAGPTGSRETRTTWEGWAIPYYSQNVEEAWEVIKWLSTDPRPQKFLADVAAVPIIKDIAYSDAFNSPDTPEDEGIFLEVLEKYGRISEFLLQGAEMDHIWNNAVEGLFLGTKTAEEAANEFKRTIDVLIQEEIQFRPYADPDMETP